MSGRAAAKARRKLVKFRAWKSATAPPPSQHGDVPAGDRLAPMPEQVPLLQVNGRLEVGEPTYVEPPKKWKPPFVSEDLWCECYHPELNVSDREWVVIWAFFGAGRGSTITAAKHLIGTPDEEGEETSEGWTSAKVRKILRKPHVHEACEYVRAVLSNACLNEHDLRAWWSSVVQNERVEIAHRLGASASLAKSMGLFIEKKQVSHDIQVDLGQLSNEELARIAAGDRIGEHVVDAQLVTTATTEEPKRQLRPPKPSQQMVAGVPAKKRGRPKGSKNKATLAKEAAQAALLGED